MTEPALNTNNNDSKLITIEPKSFVFPRTSNRVETRVIKLRNESATSQLAFKIKTTAPMHYSVRPPAGLIYPLSTVEVQIALSPNFGQEIFKHDKFLINAVVLTKPTAQEMWAEAEKRPELLIKERLTVTFEGIPPPAAASSQSLYATATSSPVIQQQVAKAPTVGSNVSMSGLFESSLMKSALSEPSAGAASLVAPPQTAAAATATPMTMMSSSMPSGILATVLDEDYVSIKPHQPSQLQYPSTATTASLSTVTTTNQPTLTTETTNNLASSSPPPPITAAVITETAPVVPAVQPSPPLVEQPTEQTPTRTEEKPQPPPQPAAATAVVEKIKDGEKEIEELKRVVEELNVKLKAVTAERDRHMARNQVLGRELEAEKKKKVSSTAGSSSSSSSSGSGPVVVYNWQWISALMILISLLIYSIFISPSAST